MIRAARRGAVPRRDKPVTREDVRECGTHTRGTPPSSRPGRAHSRDADLGGTRPNAARRAPLGDGAAPIEPAAGGRRSAS